jgi:pimeloyl-ACP methyl ester carboxylesterase
MRSRFSSGLRFRSVNFALALLLTGLQAACVEATRPPSRELPNSFLVRPSKTDPAIHIFDAPHYVYANDDIVVAHQPDLAADRHELLVFLPGTDPMGNKQTRDAPAFCALAAQLGYHVIDLKYPNDVAAAEVCRKDHNPAAFENFRLALIAGGAAATINIKRADSIENRLLKLLLYLKLHRPEQAWDQFIDATDNIKWGTIAVAGQSQGGGHAALIAIKHHVARVVCTGAPKDYSVALGRPAAWLAAPSATPKSCFFAFNHVQDFQGCSPAEQRENLHALRLDAFGAAANVDQEAPPYHHTRILTTNYPGTKLSSGEAHLTVISARNAAVFEKVWTYMLTEKTS